jgi:hypothetical protein
MRLAALWPAAPITLPAHASIFSGLYPFEHGVRNNGHFVLAADVPTCPGWTVERLVGHVGRIYRWTAGWITTGAAAEVEHEAQSEPRVRQPQPLKGGLRQDERFPLFEGDDVGGARAAVEERDLAEQVARFEEAGLSRPLVAWNDDLERASRDDEEAPVDVTVADGELTRLVQARLRIPEDDREIGLVEVPEEPAVRILDVGSAQ